MHEETTSISPIPNTLTPSFSFLHDLHDGDIALDSASHKEHTYTLQEDEGGIQSVSTLKRKDKSSNFLVSA